VSNANRNMYMRSLLYIRKYRPEMRATSLHGPSRPPVQNITRQLLNPFPLPTSILRPWVSEESATSRDHNASEQLQYPRTTSTQSRTRTKSRVRMHVSVCDDPEQRHCAARLCRHILTLAAAFPFCDPRLLRTSRFWLLGLLDGRTHGICKSCTT
jgi:hypothetical protein